MQKIIVLLLINLAIISQAQNQVKWNDPRAGNPIIPGYFADPTIEKFGDTYYLYATTDGVMFGSGEPTVWMSKDFVNWSCLELDIPYKTSTVWAPDAVIGPDGRYYYYYSNCDEGCNIYGYVSDNPIGPWKPLNDDFSPVVPDRLVKDVISLDGQILIDSKNNYWIYFCTWAKIKNSGMGWAKMNPDMKSFSETGKIPNSQLDGVFEGSYVIEKNNKFYATYSAGWCHDETYNVQYGVSDSANGTFVHGKNNPILSSTSDLTVHGPGHHSILNEGDNYYIVYHRHDNPQSTGGMFRQVCADHLYFDGDGVIKKVEPGHKGIGYLGTNQIPFENLAFGKKITASSFYIQPIVKFDYKPEYAIDDNNGTQWKAENNNMGQWIQVDLGSVKEIKRVLTQFEYATYYYQYKIEVSVDAKSWALYADRTTNRRSGSPMADDGLAKGRYLRLTFTGTEKPGMFAAIWNLKVYDQVSDFKPLTNKESVEGPAIAYPAGVVVDFDVTKLTTGNIHEIENKGSLSGKFTPVGANPVVIQNVYGVNAAVFDSNYLVLDKKCPVSLSWNSPFTYSAWVINPEVSDGECVFKWADRLGIQATYAAAYYGKNKEYGAAAHWSYPDMGYDGGVPEKNRWHHLCITFDGMIERVFVDGKINAIEQKNLFIYPEGEILIGFSGEPTEYFTGAIANIRLYNQFFTDGQIEKLMNESNIRPDYQLSGVK